MTFLKRSSQVRVGVRGGKGKLCRCYGFEEKVGTHFCSLFGEISSPTPLKLRNIFLKASFMQLYPFMELEP